MGLLGYVVYSQQRLKNRQLRKEGELQTALAKIETQNRLQEQRLRISRDLHDNIGSQLTFIISSLDNLKYRLKNVAPEINEKLTEIGAFTRTTINELRDTIWAMNKEHIYFEDLQTRISNFIDTARSLSEKITFTFKVDRNDAKAYAFTAIEGIHVYRIIQEAVNNSLKYAQAEKIAVYIKEEATAFIIEIKDDGVGFDSTKPTFGNGLSNMKKRVKEMHGNLSIQSQNDNGTSIRFTAPKQNRTNALS